jgi:hypothetical protein
MKKFTTSSLEIYLIPFPTHLHASGKFKHTTLILLSADGRGEVWMIKAGRDVHIY